MSKKKETNPTSKKADVKKVETKKPVSKDGVNKQPTARMKKNFDNFSMDVMTMANFIVCHADEIMNVVNHPEGIRDKDGKELPKGELKKLVGALRVQAKKMKAMSKKYTDFGTEKLLKIINA